MSSYVIPLFPAAAASPLPTRDAVAAELSRLRDRVDAGLPGKADKVPSASAGNLASLDASGNLADSGATPASIKAAAVAEVVANAPGTMDTLKEIADILGSSQQTGTVLERISGLETGKVDKNGTAVVAGIDASATGDGAVAVGPKRSNGQGAGASAEGNTSVALGYWSRAAAFGAVQVGYGVNSTQNSFQFRGANLFAESASGAMLLGAGFPAATAAAPGSMSAADKEKLDGIAAGATAVSVDATLMTQGAAADAKAVGDALRGGFTEWEFSGNVSPGVTYTVDITEYEGPVYVASLIGSGGTAETTGVDSLDVLTVLFSNIGITATRHLITPTKTSQLTNDGAPNGGGTPYATTAQIPDVTGKADKVAGATAGNLAVFNAQGNLADSGVKPSDFAAKADLPYALVEPGKWEITPSTYNGEPLALEWREFVEGEYAWVLSAAMYGNEILGYDENSLALEGTYLGEVAVTATRHSLPGHLCDRAGNRVVVAGDTTLTLPAVVAGYLRDFLVRLEMSGSTVPTITFAAPTGETIVYETDGDEFPVPDEAGTWLYAFTETAAHTFAVALKSVTTVTQGGA